MTKAWEVPPPDELRNEYLKLKADHEQMRKATEVLQGEVAALLSALGLTYEQAAYCCREANAPRSVVDPETNKIIKETTVWESLSQDEQKAVEKIHYELEPRIRENNDLLNVLRLRLNQVKLSAWAREVALPESVDDTGGTQDEGPISNLGRPRDNQRPALHKRYHACPVKDRRHR